MGGFLTPSELEEMGFQAVGVNVRVDRSVLVFNPHWITLGDHCRIDALALISAGPEGIRIGRHVHLGAGCQIFGGGGLVRMEDFSGLSGRASIYTSTDDFIGGWMTNPTLPDRFRNVRNAAVILRKHAGVGCGSVILPGVEMGFGSLAGALTLVRKSVREGVVLLGNPAREIAQRGLSRLKHLERELLASEGGETLPS
ncbi:MAG: acyltransferase [Cyanobacteriota bacterium]|jgi:acetyltransferase-like isoleucine patch superfamily enzyme